MSEPHNNGNDDDGEQPQRPLSYKEQQSLRRAELKSDLASLERPHVRNRWVSDKTALARNKDLRFQEKFNRNAPKRLAKHDLFLKAEATQPGLETERGEVTDRVTQDEILAGVDIQTQKKKFALTLDKLGPYMLDFSRNGTHLAFAGLRGHVASMAWQNFALDGETNLRDRCTDIKYLVDHSMFAVAQSRFVYMYTSKCVEMHVLPKFTNVTSLAYLPRHMLLCGGSAQYSTLQWMDVSTGELVASKQPAVVEDPTLCMASNPGNGILVTGDTRGVIKMWSPTVAEPLVQLKGHRGGVSHIAVHQSGRYTVSCGADNAFKVWDIRTLRALEEWRMSYVVDSLDVSQSGLVAIAGGTNVQIWKGMFGVHGQQKPFRPWLKHSLGYGNVAQSVKFCPFEDVLAIGHSRGVCSMIVPGSGEPNPDFFEANPYETDLHRKDRVVRNLLDKLPPDTISMDLQIANVDEERLQEYQEALQANRKSRNIKEKKEKRSRPAGDRAQTGLDPLKVGADVDEIDEDLGVEEKGPSRLWKSKKEKEKEKKMVRWDQKDSKDKVRSKQILRHGRVVMQQRKKRRWLEELKAQKDAEKRERAAAAVGDVDEVVASNNDAPQDNKKRWKTTTRNPLARAGAMPTSSRRRASLTVGDDNTAGQNYDAGSKQPRRRNREAGGGGESDDAADRSTAFRERRTKVANAALRRFVE